METRASPTSNMRFVWPWRPSQQRVLDMLDGHLVDRRLHIVAAPGSGKTSLGLEAFRRLGRPAVVLSPTRTIQDQWLARLAHFLEGETTFPPLWASRDLANPGFLTSVTYQALHTKYRDATDVGEDEPLASADVAPEADEMSEVIERLREMGVGTIILDEAHHLRQEWWKALSLLAEALDDATVISLTATPPYDVAGIKWQRYEALCGPIDEEISVPELVKYGTLCPHQDYVCAVRVSDKAAQRVRDHAQRVADLTTALLGDEILLEAIEEHPWLREAEASENAILNEPELVVAMLVYLRARERQLPAGVLELLDTGEEEVPEPARRWWQVLVNHYLDGDTWTAHAGREAHRDKLAKRLRSEELLHGRELRLLRSRPVEATLAHSPDKIAACVKIHRMERRLRRSGLKQVILTDFIRDEGLDSATGPMEPELGALPIFRAIAADVSTDQRIGLALLTGRLVIGHAQHISALCELLEGEGIQPIVHPLTGSLEDFVRVVSPGGSRLVGALTRMLMDGRLTLLVGTQALLGEGWDAPGVNSLVLASYVGSFMLTNQMRGRAIRCDPADAQKIASIWHLVAVAPGVLGGWSDLAGLERRFDTFVGVGADGGVLESGLDRLSLLEAGKPDWDEAINREMERRLSARDEVARQWETGILSGDVGRVLPSVRTAATTPLRTPVETREFRFKNTWRYLLWTAGAIFRATSRRVKGSKGIGAALLPPLAGAGAVAWSIPRLAWTAASTIFQLPAIGYLRGTGTALYEALRETGRIGAGSTRTEVRVDALGNGAYGISLVGASFRDSAIFADCLEALLGPIENPRYLPTRPGASWMKGRKDYHAVPAILGSRKASASALHRQWLRWHGGGERIYTRTAEGRRALLRARSRAFSSAFAKKSERFDRWQ